MKEWTTDKCLLHAVENLLDKVSRYLEDQEDVTDSPERHEIISKEVADTWVAIRDFNEKSKTKDEWWKHESKELDLTRQAEIKTAYGSILVIGKNQDEVTEEKTKGNEYGHEGSCHYCSTPTPRTRIVDMLPFAGEGGMRGIFECEGCAQEERETRERNEYVNRNIISGTSSNLF